MNELALFTGAGGGLLGSILNGWKTVCAVEIDPYCRQILLQRQVDGILEPFPIWGDIRTFNGNPWCGVVDIVSAGFPCQPFSLAGKQQGAADERNLWPETIRVIREVRPRYAFLENVPGLLSSGYFGTILGGLAEGGFDAEWCVLGADDVGAPHIRKRLWILATDPKRRFLRLQPGRSEPGRADPCESGYDGAEEPVADADERGFEGERSGGLFNGERSALRNDSDRCDCETATNWWQSEPDVGRVAHGVAHRMDRLKALGNGQVPAVVKAAWEILSASSH